MTGTDCRMSSTGISTISARLLFAASAAYEKVNTSEKKSAANIRSAVRDA